MSKSEEFPEETEEKPEETEGLPPPQPIAPTGYVTCPVCGETVSAKGRYVHFKNAHTQLNYNEYKDKFVPAPPPPEKREEGPPKPIEIETIEEALTFIKDRLQGVHGVGSNDRIIISALKDDPTPLRDPNYLHQFIKSIAPKAYDSHLSMFVVKPLYVKFPNLPTMVDRFLANTQGPQPPQYPYYFTPQTVQSYPQYTVPPQPSYTTPQPYPQPYQPYQLPVGQPATYPPQPTHYGPWAQPQYIPPPTMSPERYVEDRLRTTEERLTRLIDEKLKPKEEKVETYVEIEEPVRDKEGNYVVDDSGKAITKKMRVPASQAALYTKPEDVELKVLEKMKMYREVLGIGKEAEAPPPQITKDDVKATIMEVLEEKEKKLTPEQVMEIVEKKLTEKFAKTEEPEELKGLRAELAENKRKLEELKETLTLKEKEALENRIKSLESDIRRVETAAAGKVVEGYREDEFRFMGQGLDRLAGVLEKKEPVKIVIEKLPEITSMATGVIPQGQAPPARVGLLQILREKGLTTPQ